MSNMKFFARRFLFFWCLFLKWGEVYSVVFEKWRQSFCHIWEKRFLYRYKNVTAISCGLFYVSSSKFWSKTGSNPGEVKHFLLLSTFHCFGGKMVWTNVFTNNDTTSGVLRPIFYEVWEVKEVLKVLQFSHFVNMLLYVRRIKLYVSFN